MTARPLWLWMLVPLVAMTCVSCRDAETITTFETPRSGDPPTAVDVAEVRKSLDTMLAAMVPQGEKAWFFKLVAPGHAVEELQKPFNEFVKSIELGEGGAPPKWTLPAGWVEKPGDENRAATIEIPQGGEKLELTVSSLALSGEWAPYVARNVNRWLGQLQQNDLPPEKIAKLTRRAAIKGGEATVVELRGIMDRTAAMMPAGHPPIGASRPTAASGSPTERTEAPAPPAVGEAKTPATADLRQAGFTYETPAEWRPGTMSPGREAAFNVVEGGGKAEMVVTTFQATSGMADPIVNAQRWAGQAGVGPLSEEDVDAASRDIEIDGTKAQQFEFLGAQSEAPRGILAAMVRRGDTMWFFKIAGDRAVVESQRGAFNDFLKSVRFPADDK